jgi:WXG100 family type VII secretion target
MRRLIIFNRLHNSFLGPDLNRIALPPVYLCKGERCRAATWRQRQQTEREPIVPNVNVTYADMQSAANQLKAGEQQIEGDLARLKQLVDNLVAGGYVTDSSSRQFEASYAEFNTGATKMVQGLTGMGQYLDAAARAFQETDAQLAAALK